MPGGSGSELLKPVKTESGGPLAMMLINYTYPR